MGLRLGGTAVVSVVAALAASVVGLSAGPVAAAPRSSSVSETELTPSGGPNSQQFGASEILAGTIAVITAGSQGEPVYVFSESSGAWRQAQTLEPPNSTIYWSFGESADLSGSRIVIGAPGQSGAPNAGFVYLYTHGAGGWVESARISEPDPELGFGDAVALSGRIALVGAPRAYGPRTKGGAVYVYTLRASRWRHTATLTAPPAVTRSGKSLLFGDALAFNGRTALIGAPYQAGGMGAVYVFRDLDGRWSRLAEISAPNRIRTRPGRFGASLALSNATAVVGAPDHQVDGKLHAGAAYVLQRQDGRWRLTNGLTAPNADESDGFGGSVTIYGSRIAVGAGAHPNSGACTPGSPCFPGPGAAYVFNKTARGWSRPTELTAFDGKDGDGFGAVSLYGRTLMVGAPGHTRPGDRYQTGAVYVCTPI